jgi:hypothetical protein
MGTCTSTQNATQPLKREKFSCTAEQFDSIVAFAESNGLLQESLRFVVLEYTRSRLH